MMSHAPDDDSWELPVLTGDKPKVQSSPRPTPAASLPATSARPTPPAEPSPESRPYCPVHTKEKLELKRKGWFCEECGSVVLPFGPGQEEPDRPSSPGGSQGNSPVPPSSRSGSPSCSPGSNKGLAWKETTRRALLEPATLAARKTLERAGDYRRLGASYVERRGVDDVLEQCLARSGRGLLVLGEAGAGKSWLLARLVQKLLTRPESPPEKPAADSDDSGAGRVGDVVLYLSGREAYGAEGANSPQELLCEVILRAAGIRAGVFDSLTALAAKLAKTDPMDAHAYRRVWLVLDAIDAADRFVDLCKALDAFLPVLERYPWLRLVTSMRQSSYQSLSAQVLERPYEPGRVFENGRYWIGFGNERMGQVPYLSLRLWETEAERRAAYELRQRRYPDQSAAVSYDTLSAHVRGLLRVPLYQHLFHEAYRGLEKVPAELSEELLLDGCFKRLGQDCPSLGTALPKLAKSMLERKSTVLPAEIYDGAKEEPSTERAKRRAWEELAGRTSLLQALYEAEGKEQKLVGWQLGHGRLSEHLLARELERRAVPRQGLSAAELVSWSKVTVVPGHGGLGRFAAAWGALELAAYRWVAAGEVSWVGALASDVEPEPLRRLMLASVLSALGQPLCSADTRQTVATRLLDGLGTGPAKIERAKRFLLVLGMGLERLAQAPQPAPISDWVSRLRVILGASTPRAESSEDPTLSGAFNALGELVLEAGALAEAYNCFEEAERRVALPKSIEGCRQLLWALRRLEELAQEGSLRESVRKRLELALSTARERIRDESENFSLGQELLLTLLQLGRSARRQGREDQGRLWLEEARTTARTILSQVPYRGDLESTLSAVLLALAEVLEVQGNMSEGRKQQESALALLRSLIQREPQRPEFRRSLVQLLQRRGAGARAAHEDEDARVQFEEAVAVMRLLVELRPERTDWAAEYVRMLNNLGLLLRQCAEDDAAKACFEEAQGLLRQLVSEQDGPAEHRASLLMVLNNLAHLAEWDGRRSEARRYFRESLEVVRAMMVSGGKRGDAARELASVLLNLGHLAADDGDVDGARWYWAEALRSLSERLAVQPNRADLQESLNVVLKAIGTLIAAGHNHIRPPKHRFSVIIREKGAPQVTEYFDRDEITIGRAPGNELMLPNYSVSRHHARVRLQEGRFTIEDLGSKHGTCVNRVRISRPTVLADGDRVELGEFRLQFERASVRDAADEAEAGGGEVQLEGPGSEKSPSKGPDSAPQSMEKLDASDVMEVLIED